ncbi:major capsid protein [Micromonospora sp. WMMC250]|uniref:major capsid protein n=1 Tax=Micromonospora sp. WMMC250 TaxID=3014781 RepID=UPI0022B694C4|nr:phage major capsid protein [Micromonospora sp. WMMC250]MCZ7376541.1 phage major capsid protein [Micromonospora sp. WMMC250]
MPVTLAQAKLNATDDVDVAIIDEFQKSSDVMNRITFDDVVSGAGNGATLTYSYTRQITQRGAAFRAINSEYTPTEATKQRYSVDLKPLGGSFQVDRVLNRVAQAAETAFQMRELLKASSAKFNDAFFNGDTAVDANGFDGLSKLLTGTATEYLPLSNGVSVGYLDWTAVNTQALAFAQIAHIDAWLGLLDGRPDAIYLPRKARALFKTLASFGGQYSVERNSIGEPVDTYNGIPLIDPGTKDGSSTDVLALATRDADGAGGGGNITNLADLYAVRFGLDGVHGVSMAGGPLVQNWMPDFSTAGAVKTGEAELGPAAVVVKRTKSAAVLRNVKVG